jgi:hypothetical protein
MKIIYVVILIFIVSSCYRKSLLIEADTISVTKNHSGNKKLKIGSEGEWKWCSGEKVLYKKGGSGVGLAEQAIYKAQGKGKKADFIVNARVYVDSEGCAFVEGSRAKISSSKMRKKKSRKNSKKAK